MLRGDGGGEPGLRFGMLTFDGRHSLLTGLVILVSTAHDDRVGTLLPTARDPGDQWHVDAHGAHGIAIDKLGTWCHAGIVPKSRAMRAGT
jgi:hypothetical protein